MAGGERSPAREGGIRRLTLGFDRDATPDQRGRLRLLGCLAAALGLAWLTILIVIAVAGGAAYALLTAVLVLLLAGVPAVRALRRYRRLRAAARRLGPIDVSLSPVPVAPGESLVCHVAFRPTEPIRLTQLTASLAAGDAGSDAGPKRATSRAARYERTRPLVPPGPIEAGEPVAGEASFDFSLPAPGAGEPDRPLTWTLTLRFVLADGAEIIREVPIEAISDQPSAVRTRKPEPADG